MTPSTPSPWPAPTLPPFVDQYQRRAPIWRWTLETRQGIADQSQVDQALVDCAINSGNDVYSCFPTANTHIDQHQYASFVWNSLRPELLQTNLVDIFLFRAGTKQQLLHFSNVTNPSDQAGLIRTQVNDIWFGSDGLNYSNTNLSFPFYWVIIQSDKTLDGNEVAQPTFTAVQTTMLDSVAAASSSAAIAAASLSSLSVARAATSTNTNTGTNPSTSSFPHWAIAVIVILVAATCLLLAFLILRRLRWRRNSHRNAMGSTNCDSVTGGGDGASTQGGHRRSNVSPYVLKPVVQNPIDPVPVTNRFLVTPKMSQGPDHYTVTRVPPSPVAGNSNSQFFSSSTAFNNNGQSSHLGSNTQIVNSDHDTLPNENQQTLETNEAENAVLSTEPLQHVDSGLRAIDPESIPHDGRIELPPAYTAT